MSSGWWAGSSGVGYVKIKPDEENRPRDRGIGDVPQAPEGWGIAYSTAYNQDNVPTQESRTVDVEGADDNKNSLFRHNERRVSWSQTPRLYTKDAPHVFHAANFRTRREETYSTAWPVQRWFRASVALISMLVGSCCIQVGLREEDSLCQATFGSLLVISGFAQLVQACICVYLVVNHVGSEGEEPRRCLFLIEIILWVFVFHELLLDTCKNRKLPATAAVYLFASAIVWMVTAYSWFTAMYQARSTPPEDQS